MAGYAEELRQFRARSGLETSSAIDSAWLPAQPELRPLTQAERDLIHNGWQRWRDGYSVDYIEEYVVFLSVLFVTQYANPHLPPGKGDQSSMSTDLCSFPINLLLQKVIAMADNRRDMHMKTVAELDFHDHPLDTFINHVLAKLLASSMLTL